MSPRTNNRLRIATVAALVGTLAACVEATSSRADRSDPQRAAAFTAVAASSTQVNLSWPPSSEADVAGYKVFRDGVVIAAVRETLYVDRNLLPATTYSYTYLIFDIAGNESAQSAPVTATTLADDSPKSFAADVFPILQTCVGCHAEYATPHRAYVSVTGRGIGVCGGRPTTVAGSATRSLLYQKVTGLHDCGVVMPPSGRLSSPQASVIGTWINQGAADN